MKISKINQSKRSEQNDGRTRENKELRYPVTIWLNGQESKFFFFLSYSFVSSASSSTKLTDREEEWERERMLTPSSSSSTYTTYFWAMSLRACSDTREKNTIAILVLNSPCMNSYHPHIGLLNKKRLSNLSRWWKLIHFLSTLFFLFILLHMTCTLNLRSVLCAIRDGSVINIFYA